MVLLQILADDVPELDEGFKVTLAQVIDGDAVIVSPDTMVVTIAGNDDQHGVVGFDPVMEFPVYMNEDAVDGGVFLMIIREGGAFGNVSTIAHLCTHRIASHVAPAFHC